MKEELRVDPTACSGHGLCAELLPELVTLEPAGVVTTTSTVPKPAGDNAVICVSLSIV